MAKKNRICIACGKHYTYCISCSDQRDLEAWHAIYCSSNCRDIYNIASDYIFGSATKEDAKERFCNCDMSYKDALHHKIIEVVDEVCKEPKVEDVKIKPRHAKKMSEVDETNTETLE